MKRFVLVTGGLALMSTIAFFGCSSPETPKTASGETASQQKRDSTTSAQSAAQKEIRDARTCQENLSRIDGAKENFALDESLDDGATVTWSNIVNPDGTGYMKKKPVCPRGGEYIINTIGTDPVCTYGRDNPESNHVLP